jgi:hypothetical protein
MIMPVQPIPIMYSVIYCTEEVQVQGCGVLGYAKVKMCYDFAERAVRGASRVSIGRKPKRL